MSSNGPVDIEIFKSRVAVEIEGLTQIEIATLAREVAERMEDLAQQNKKIADSAKLAILTAIHYAADNYKLKGASSNNERYVETKMESMMLQLQKALSSAKK